MRADSYRLLIIVAASVFAVTLRTEIGIARDNPSTKRGAMVLHSADIQVVHKVIGTVDIDALVADTVAFINALDLFKYLHVHTNLSEDESTISGFYISENRNFEINAAKRSIQFEGHRYLLGDTDCVLRPTGLYLATAVLGRVFALKCDYNPYKLRVDISSKETLPAEREIADEQRRKRSPQALQSIDPIPDRVFPLSRSLFSLGALDWSFSGSYSKPTAAGNYQLQLGSQLVGGDFDALLSGMYHQSIDWNMIPWRWRLPIQNTSILRTVLVGRRAPFSNLQLADSMVGIQLSNGGSSNSISSQSTYTNYTISDHTEPDWIVELYVNDELKSYVRADQTGYYKFVFPLPYGATDIRLRFLGPYGEVRTKDLSFRIPYAFLRPGDVEYELSGGTSAANPAFSNAIAKLDAKIGISTALTLGSGFRYAEDPYGVPVLLPSLSSSLRLSSSVVASADYYYQRGFRGSLDITTLGGFYLGAKYESSLSQQLSSIDNIVLQNQRTLNISAPLPWKAGTLLLNAIESPMNGTQGNVQATGTLNLEAFGSTLSTSASASFLRDRFTFRRMSAIQALGNLSYSTPPIFSILFRPSVDLDFGSGKILNWGVSAMRFIGSDLSFNLSFAHNIQLNTNSIQGSLGITLPFVQSGFTANTSTRSTPLFGTSVQGSTLFDAGTGDIIFDNRSTVRTGGVAVEPFRDENNNGKRDPGEPIVNKVDFDQSYGTTRRKADSTLRITGLEPYTSYYFKTSMKSVESASLLPKYESFQVTPPANGFAKIELPILTVGQIEGYASVQKQDGQKPLGGVRIKIQHADAADTTLIIPAEDLLTYSNGEYFYLGLMPGKYRVFVDPKQLQAMNKIAVPAFREITIVNKDEGDVVEDLDFELRENPSKEQQPSEPK